MLAAFVSLVMVNFLMVGLVVALVFDVFDGLNIGGGIAHPHELALILLLLRINQLLTYTTKNLDEIKELLIEDEDQMSEIMYHPPYEVEE